MNNAQLQLGRIRGIEVRLSYTWLIPFALIIWVLAGVYLPRAYPEWSSLAHIWAGLLASTLFFASILAHELGHGLVARRYGVPVRDITLTLFGGAARLDREPPHPRADLLIALAGPAVSLSAALVFGLPWWLGGGRATPLFVVAGWVAGANLLLALFNLLPGLPLDGGRVVRAVAWRITGDRHRATLLAATLGRVVAFFLIFWGIWQVAGGHWVDGLWIGLIGWFLAAGATTTARYVRTRQLLAGHTVRAVMVHTPHLQPWLTLDVAVEQMLLPSGQRALPVVDEGRLYGVLTLAQVRAVPAQRWPYTRVFRVMEPEERLRTVTPNDDLAVTFERMNEEQVREYVVVEDGQVVGMVGMDSLATFLHLRDQPIGSRPAA